MVPRSTNTPTTVNAAGPVLHAPAMCAYTGSLLHISSFAAPAMMSRLPATAEKVKKPHIHLFFGVPQPQYTISIVSLLRTDCPGCTWLMRQWCTFTQIIPTLSFYSTCNPLEKGEECRVRAVRGVRHLPFRRMNDAPASTTDFIVGH